MATDHTLKLTRRKRAECRAMPIILTSTDVTDVHAWPLGAIKTKSARGQDWTDCVIFVEERIRLGGRYNSRRVRLGPLGFYIVHNGRRVPFSPDLVLRVADVVSHVYGVNAESDILHNKAMKGY